MCGLRLCLLLTLLFNVSNMNMYSSVHRMNHALNVPLPSLIAYLEIYVDMEERRNMELERALEDLKNLQENLLAVIDLSEGDALSYYKFADFFTTNWHRFKENTDLSKSEGTRQQISELRDDLPTNNDTVGMIMSIARTQEIMSLNATDIADGIFLGQKSITMSAKDCYDFSRTMKNKSNIRLALDWLEASSNRIQSQKEIPLVENYAGRKRFLNTKLINSSKTTLEKLNTKMWKELPHVLETILTTAKENTSSEAQLQNAKMLMEKYHQGKIRYAGKEINRNLDDHINFEKLCKQKFQTAAEGQPETNICFYASNPNPFYKFRKIKLERFSKTPLLIQIHDVVYEKEIELLKEIAFQRLQRTVLSPFNSTIGEDNSIVENCHLDMSTDLHMKIETRIKTMLQLHPNQELEEEPYSIANYGPGGLFDLHVDLHVNYEAHKAKTDSYRMFTILFYISNVEYGGHTVFPRLDVSIKPAKGSAVLWQNMREDSDPWHKTMHASCPVVLGVKWIVSKSLLLFANQPHVVKSSMAFSPKVLF